jgi:subtilisin family serine protease
MGKLKHAARRSRLAQLLLLAALVAGATAPAAAANPSGQGLCGISRLVDALLCSGRASSGGGGQAAPAPAPAPAGASVQHSAAMPAPRYEPGRLVVTFAPGTGAAAAADVLARAHVTRERAIPQIHAYLVGVAPERRAQALESLRSSPSVASADREILLDALDTTPNDAAWGNQWGLRIARFPQAWDVTHGSRGLVVAVVDTGVARHADLAGALVAGYDFVNSDADPTDDHGHGTAVAGIIAARTNNASGVAGICWTCSIMPVKVLGADGSGDTALVAAGIVWAVDHGARVINLSLGGPGATPALHDAVAYATGKGALVVAAAGNSGTSAPFYPAAEHGVVSVAATDEADRLYGWSNYGSSVVLAAPGCNLAPTLDGGYGDFCGTSSASPIVAGLVALALAVKPNATAAEVQQAVTSTTAPVAGTLQHGRVNAAAALGALGGVASAAHAVAFYRGTLTPRVRSVRYSRTIGAGDLTATLHFDGARTLTLLLVGADGKTIARADGASGLRLERTLPAGTFRLVVRGATRRAKFTLAVSSANGGS